MRITFAFSALLASFILWLLPVTTAVYDFRTDVRSDAFTVATGVGVTSANTVLLAAIYDDDTNTISYTSSIAETPVFNSYNNTTRLVNTTGLTANTSRTLTVNYDINALSFSDAIGALLDWWPFIWYMLITLFPIASLIVVVFIWR